ELSVADAVEGGGRRRRAARSAGAVRRQRRHQRPAADRRDPLGADRPRRPAAARAGAARLRARPRDHAQRGRARVRGGQRLHARRRARSLFRASRLAQFVHRNRAAVRRARGDQPMGNAAGRTTDALTFFAELAGAPYRYDFYQTLRRLECLYEEKPRWGRALRPIDEPVRLGQEPDLSFAPAPLASFESGGGPRLQVRLFGLFGPNGPMPLHLTEYARERLHHAGDPTLSRFLDIFHHRFLALFYRAWAQAQPAVNHDRPRDDRFTVYVGS